MFVWLGAFFSVHLVNIKYLVRRAVGRHRMTARPSSFVQDSNRGLLRSLWLLPICRCIFITLVLASPLNGVFSPEKVLKGDGGLSPVRGTSASYSLCFNVVLKLWKKVLFSHFGTCCFCIFQGYDFSESYLCKHKWTGFNNLITPPPPFRGRQSICPFNNWIFLLT